MKPPYRFSSGNMRGQTYYKHTKMHYTDDFLYYICPYVNISRLLNSTYATWYLLASDGKGQTEKDSHNDMIIFLS